MPSSKTIGQRLHDIRDGTGLSQEKVARAMDVSTRMYQRYEAGENSPGVPELEAFCKVTGSTLGQVLFDNEQEFMKGLSPLRRIPIVNEIPASGFILSFDESPTDQWTYTDNLVEEGLFALRVRGNSMSPRIDDGDIVIVAPQREFENNKIYAVVIDGDEHTLKTVRKVDGGYWLLPFNIADHQPMFVKEDQVVRFYRIVKMQKTL